MAKRVGLGAVLRKIASEKDPEKVTSIVDAIDKACSEGITSVGAFSVIGMQRSCKKMSELLTDFKREEFFVEFFKMYNLAMAPDMRARNVFHPSQLMEDCPRKLTYDLMGVAPTDVRSRVISGSLQRVFDVGTWYHVYIQNILYQLGLLEQAEVPVVNPERYLNGKADGVFKKEVFGCKTVLEIKTMNSFIYGRAIFKPFKKHEFQASLYARELGAEKVLYLYINKDTSEIKQFLEPLNEEMLDTADKKMESIISHMKKETLPARKCSDKMCDAAIECPFSTLCFTKK